MDSIQTNAKGIGVLDLQFRASGLAFDPDSTRASGLQQHVGRSLTIHEGASASSPTVAAAACGIAHPHATIDTEFASAPPAGLSPGVGEH